MARHWTPEQRARQAEAIRRWKPWERSTGPKTPEGRAVSSKNVLVGAENRERALEQAFKELEAAEAKIRELKAKCYRFGR